MSVGKLIITSFNKGGFQYFGNKRAAALLLLVGFYDNPPGYQPPTNMVLCTQYVNQFNLNGYCAKGSVEGR